MAKASPTNDRAMRRELKIYREECGQLRRDLQEARGRLTRAQQEAAEWKQRFDALLMRVPMKPLEATETA